MRASHIGDRTLSGLQAALLSSVAVVAMLSATAVQAQQDQARPDQVNTVDDVVVTAQRTSQKLQDVPASVVAVTAEQIVNSGLTDFADLKQLAPGLNTDQNGDARAARIGMRGVTTSQEMGKQSSVGVFIDSVYMARTGMAFNDLLDIERIEVLRGPQGTLFGMNTSAGLIHILTRKPNVDSYGGFVEGVVGNYDRTELRGSVTGPIVPGTLGFSLGASYVDRGGIIYNQTQQRHQDDLHRWGVRGKLGYEGERLDVQLIADYSEENSDCCVKVLTYLAPGATFLGVPVAPIAPAGYPFSRVAITGGENFNRPEGGGLSAEANYSLASGHTLTSVTAVRYWDISASDDADSLPFTVADIFDTEQQHNQFSQELRLASPKGGRFEYLAGLFYFDRDASEQAYSLFDSPALHAPGQDGSTSSTFDLNAKTYAVFGRIAYNLTDKLNVALGLRYTSEKQTMTSAQVSRNYVYPTYNRAATRTDESVTYNLTANYKYNEDLMFYAAHARGFKPGGFDVGRPASVVDFQFEEETNYNNEIGMRSVWMNRRLLVNATLFYTIYENFQTRSFDGLRFLNTNAPEFTTVGLEVEVVARPAKGLDLRLSGSLIEAKYTDFKTGGCPQGVAGFCDLTGRELNQAPRTTLSASAQYERPVSVNWSAFILGEAAYRSDYYSDQALDPHLRTPGYTLVNLRLGVENAEGLRIEAWAKNLFNEEYVNFGFNSPLLTGGYAGFLGEPRMYGLRVRRTF